MGVMYKLMGIFPCVAAASETVDFSPNIFDAIKAFFIGFLQESNIIVWLLDLIGRVIYLISEFMMLFIDFMFIFIRQITGINTDFSSLENLEESDVIFSFIFSDTVTDVLKGVIIIAIVVILLFSIIAIIQNEYLAATTGANNKKSKIFASALKSLFLIVIVPFIVIGSIFLSNAILASLYNVTSGGTHVSMGTQVYMASSYQANAYRSYADSGYRIPITYSFDTVQEDENIAGWDEGGTLEEMEEAYEEFANSSVWNKGLATYIMFSEKEFMMFDDIEKADVMSGGANGNYHLTYDKGLFFRKAEYYQMAEVVDYAMKNHVTLYFKTPQEIKESQESAGFAVTGTNYDDFFISADGNDVKFKVDYTNGGTATYIAKDKVNGVYDETNGSVFVIARRESGDTGAGIKDYFVPLIAGYDFASQYTDGKNPVVARGIFDEGVYPTAIKSVDGSVRFYRDEIYVPAIMDFLPKISYELPEGQKESFVSKVLKVGVHMATGVNPDDYIPYIYFNFDIRNLYSKTFEEVNRFSGDGGFSLNYTFNDDDARMQDFYDFKKIDLTVLIFCATIILSMLLKAVFGVSGRIFDIVLLFVAYPAICATLPLDNGSRFKSWTETFVGSLFSVYGVVIGLNLVLLLYPIVDGITIFTPADFDSIVARGILPTSWSAALANHLIRIMMIFALFALFKTIIQIVSSILGKNVNGDVIERGQSALEESKKLIKTTSNIVTGKIIVDGIQSAKDMAIGFIPGSAIVSEAADFLSTEGRKRKLEKAIKGVKKEINKGDTSTVQKAGDKAKDTAEKAKEAREKKENSRKK